MIESNHKQVVIALFLLLIIFSAVLYMAEPVFGLMLFLYGIAFLAGLTILSIVIITIRKAWQG